MSCHFKIYGDIWRYLEISKWTWWYLMMRIWGRAWSYEVAIDFLLPTTIPELMTWRKNGNPFISRHFPSSQGKEYISNQAISSYNVSIGAKVTFTGYSLPTWQCKPPPKSLTPVIKSTILHIFVHIHLHNNKHSTFRRWRPQPTSPSLPTVHHKLPQRQHLEAPRSHPSPTNTGVWVLPKPHQANDMS